MEENKKFLFVDGSNLLFQMFFGMPARITGRDGRAIQGTLGFVGALLKIIRMVQPTHAAVFFDGEHENARAQLDADYKANRPDYGAFPEEESPFSQLPDVYRALDCMGIAFAETTDCETDDWIAACAFTYGKEDPVVISSFDSDFFQLVTDNVSVLRYRGKKTALCTPEYVQERFGVSPRQYADFKSLVGDTADNIRGAAQVGPKTAASLLAAFGTLEGVLQNAEKIKKAAVRASIQQDADRLRRNYALIRLNGCAALPFVEEEMRYAERGWTTTEVLRQIGLR